MTSPSSHPPGEGSLVESNLDQAHNEAIGEVASAEQCGFQFVAVTSPLQGRSSDMGRKIRAHVARRYHRLQRRGRGRRSIAPVVAREGGEVVVDLSEDDDASRIRLCPTCRQPINDFDSSTINFTDANAGSHNHDQRESWSQNIEGYYPMRDTVTIASPGSRNPFDESSWLRAPPESHRVVDNFIGQYFEANRSSKSPMRSTIMLAGLIYIGLFHGHIYTSIVNVAMLNEKPLGPLSLMHRSYATHFINESLVDSRQGCSDEVILTVLTIFNVECLAANIESAEVHMQGIQLMVNLRGGLDKLGYGGQVKWIILAHDYILCIITSRLAHRFEVDTSPNTHPGPSRKVDFPTDFRLFTLGKYFINPTQFVDVSRDSVNILQYLCRLSNISTDWHDHNPLTEIEKLSLANRWLSIRSSLLSLPSSNSSIVLGVTDDYVYESCRVAGIILSSVGLRTIDPYFSEDEPRLPYLKLLKESLERTNLFQFWHPIPGALMWVLAIGARFTEKGREKSWFLAQLARTYIVYALTQWDEVEISLKAVLYALKGMD